ncbi:MULTISPECIES: putative leader peptide [unclassified Streptomyces]|nr:putative leader peptide [Streptomyces sp. SID4985]
MVRLVTVSGPMGRRASCVPLRIVKSPLLTSRRHIDLLRVSSAISLV